jgi:hypothetical protein
VRGEEKITDRIWRKGNLGGEKTARKRTREQRILELDRRMNMARNKERMKGKQSNRRKVRKADIAHSEHIAYSSSSYASVVTFVQSLYLI